MKLELAKNIADNIVEQLAPFCEPDRIFIAGSVRRGKSEVHDIEIVCRPLVIVGETAPDLFGSTEKLGGVSPEFTSRVNRLGHIVKGKTDGRYMQINLQEISLDLFMPTPQDFFRQFAIRTGSSEYAHRVIASAWVGKGWVGTSQGLRLKEECHRKETAGKVFWIPVKANPTLPPQWCSEQEFFKWLGVSWVAPDSRELK